MSERTSQTRLFLIGGGGHAAVVWDAATLAGHDVVGFYDDRASGSPMHRLVPQLGSFFDLPQLSADTNTSVQTLGILAVGETKLRERLTKFYRERYVTIVHPTAVVSSQATIGDGCFVAACAVINSNARVGDHAIVNTRAIVEHDCVLATNVHVGPGAVLGGGVHVGSGTLIGLNSSIKPNVRIGRHCIVGAGAVVVNDVDDNDVVMGVPARTISRDVGLRRSA